MMARRMMRKHHVRCRAGEKVEIIFKTSPIAIGFSRVRKALTAGRVSDKSAEHD